MTGELKAQKLDDMLKTTTSKINLTVDDTLIECFAIYPEKI